MQLDVQVNIQYTLYIVRYVNNNNNNHLKFNVDIRRKWYPQSSESGAHVKAFNHYYLRWIKLRLIFRREENRRTRIKTLEARERPTTTTILT